MRIAEFDQSHADADWVLVEGISTRARFQGWRLEAESLCSGCALLGHHLGSCRRNAAAHDRTSCFHVLTQGFSFAQAVKPQQVFFTGPNKPDPRPPHQAASRNHKP